MTFSLVDIGINLMHRSFHEDRQEVIKRAEAAGVTQLIITGTSVRSSREAANYAATQPGKLYSTAGVHPHDAKDCHDKTIDQLRELAQKPHVVAIGECGLDYDRDFSPRDVQRHWFEAQLQLAVELGMPLFLHERAAHRDFVALLKPYVGKLDKAVVHCFTGTEMELRTYLSMGLYIGITGWICDERRGLHLRNSVKLISPDRLMIETDAPFLTPRDLRPKPKDGRNEPAFLPHILQAVARSAGRSMAQVAEQTAQTSRMFFGI